MSSIPASAPSAGDDVAVRELLDRAAIRDLVDRFVVALDVHDERGYDDDWYRSVFTEDVRLSFPIHSHEGVDGFAAFQSVARSRWERGHHLASTPEVVLDGDDATARTSVIATHVHLDASGPHADPLLRVGGHYDVRARRTAAGWRLAQITFSMTWSTGTGPRLDG